MQCNKQHPEWRLQQPHFLFLKICISAQIELFFGEQKAENIMMKKWTIQCYYQITAKANATK